MMANREGKKVKRHYKRADNLPPSTKLLEFTDFMADLEQLPTYWPFGELLSFMHEVRKLRKTYDKRLKAKYSGYF